MALLGLKVSLPSMIQFIVKAAMLNDWQIIGYNFESRHPKNDSVKRRLKLAQWFQRRRLLT